MEDMKNEAAREAVRLDRIRAALTLLEEGISDFEMIAKVSNLSLLKVKELAAGKSA